MAKILYAPYVFINKESGTDIIKMFVLTPVNGNQLSDPIPSGSSTEKTYTFNIVSGTPSPHSDFSQKMVVINSAGSIQKINVVIVDPVYNLKKRSAIFESDDWDTDVINSVSNYIAYQCPYVCLQRGEQSSDYFPKMLLPLQDNDFVENTPPGNPVPTVTFITAITLQPTHGIFRIEDNLETNNSRYIENTSGTQIPIGWFESNIGATKIKIKNKHGNPMPPPTVTQPNARIANSNNRKNASKSSKK